MNSALLVCCILGVDLHAGEQKMVDYVNASRQQAGLNPLVVDETLQEGTRKHCMWMASVHSMTHAHGWRENIAMGQQSCWQCHVTWMNSSGHRANILSRATKIGVAAYVSSSGRVYYCMRVQ